MNIGGRLLVLLFITAISSVPYLIGAFVSWELDVSQWHKASRLLMAIITAFVVWHCLSIWASVERDRMKAKK